MSFHKNKVGADIHVLNAETYADISARDADTAFNTDSSNVNKVIRVDSPLSYFILASTVPTFTELSNTAFDTLAEVLANGNTTGGTDLVISSGDDLLVTDQMSVGSVTAPATDTSIDLKSSSDALKLNPLTTTQRDALTPLSGMIIYNTTTDDVENFDGVAWVGMGGGDVVGPPSSAAASVPTFNGTTGKNIQDPNTMFIADNSVGIGIATADGTLHVHTASAGAIGPSSFADDLIVENSSDGGIAILTPDASFSAIEFGSPSRQTGAQIKWKQSTGNMVIGTAETGAKLNFQSGFASTELIINENGIVEVVNNLQTPIVTFTDSSTQATGATPDGIGWHPSTLTDIQTSSVATQDNLPLTIFVRADGLKLYMIGNESPTQDIFEYDMTVPWDISTLAFLQSFSTGQGAARGLYFKPDGTKFYIMRFTGSSTEFTMTTPWDVTTASLTGSFNPAGGIQGIFFKPDGFRFYSNATGPEVRQYDLAVAWDLDTASDPTISVAVADGAAVSFRPDGRSMFVTGTSTITEYELSTPWDITTLNLIDTVVTALSGIGEIVFKEDGTKFMALDQTTDLVHEFDLGIKTSKVLTNGMLSTDNVKIQAPTSGTVFFSITDDTTADQLSLLYEDATNESFLTALNNMTINSLDGSLDLTSGDADGGGGDISITTGNATAGTTDGGTMTFTTGNGSGISGLGGSLNFVTGDSGGGTSGSGGGDVSFTLGDNPGDPGADFTVNAGFGGNGGAVNLTAGTGGIAGTMTLKGGAGGGSNAGGLVTVIGGNGGPTNAVGGEVKITGGAAGGTSSAGSDITIEAGNSGASAGNGGDLTLFAGGGAGSGGILNLNAGDGTFSGGPVNINAGNVTGSGVAGTITLLGGISGGSSAGGQVHIFGGIGGDASGNGGQVLIHSGSGGNSQGDGGLLSLEGGQGFSSGDTDGGDVDIQGGQNFGTGVHGDVLIANGGGAVGIGSTPLASAILNVASTTKGFMQPRLTETQRDAVAAPDAGLSVYSSTSDSPEFFNGTDWIGYEASSDTVYVRSVSDLPAPSAGVITLASNKVYKLLNSVDIGTDRLVTGNVTSFIGLGANQTILSGTTTGALITTNGTNRIEITDIGITQNGSGELMSLTTDAFDANIFIDSNFRGGIVRLFSTGGLILRGAGFLGAPIVFDSTASVDFVTAVSTAFDDDGIIDGVILFESGSSLTDFFIRNTGVFLFSASVGIRIQESATITNLNFELSNIGVIDSGSIGLVVENPDNVGIGTIGGSTILGAGIALACEPTPESSISPPGPIPAGLGWDGVNLIISDTTDNEIVLMVGKTAVEGTVIVSPGTSIRGVVWLRGNLFSTDEVTDLIYKHVGFTTSTTTFATPAGNTLGMTTDGTNLIVVDGTTNLVYVLDPDDGTIIKSFNPDTSAQDLQGITFDGVNIILSDDVGMYVMKGISGVKQYTISLSSPAQDLVVTDDGLALLQFSDNTVQLYDHSVTFDHSSATWDLGSNSGVIVESSDRGGSQFDDSTAQTITIATQNVFVDVADAGVNIFYGSFNGMEKCRLNDEDNGELIWTGVRDRGRVISGLATLTRSAGGAGVDIIYNIAISINGEIQKDSIASIVLPNTTQISTIQTMPITRCLVATDTIKIQVSNATNTQDPDAFASKISIN